MPEEIERKNFSWAELRPDCYAGDSCEEIAPRWYAETEGDMSPEEGIQSLDFPAHLFPPGTKITVEVPVCPQCHEMPMPYPMPGSKKSDYIRQCRCGCGFDWEAWAIDRFS